MRIGVVSFWYNEAQLAPFFLSHYAFADVVHLVIDTASTDGCRDIAARYPNVEIEDSTFPNGQLDDGLKVDWFNRAVAALDCDWAIAVDADEYVFPRAGESVWRALARQSGNVVKAELLNVYRHVTDGDLDPMRPTIEQRRHGDPRVQRGYTKPIIVKPETLIEWTPGNHYYKPNVNIRESVETFAGAHWQWADVEIALVRKLKGRRDRLSPNNLKNGWGTENLNWTEAIIRQECAAHANDPLLF